MFPVAQPDGGDEIYLAFIMDIGDKQAEKSLSEHPPERQRLDDERYRTIVEQTDTLVFEWNLETDTRYISPEIGYVSPGTTTCDLMHVWREDIVIHPDDLPCSPLFSRIRAPSAIRDDRPLPQARRRVRSDDKATLLPCATWGNQASALNDVMARAEFRARAQVRAGPISDDLCQHAHLQAAQAVHAYPERRWQHRPHGHRLHGHRNDLYGGLEEGDKLLIAIADLLREKMAGNLASTDASAGMCSACAWTTP